MTVEKGKVFFDDTFQVFGVGLQEIQKSLEGHSFKQVDWFVTDDSGVVEIRIKSGHLRAFNRVKKHILDEYSKYLLVGPNQTYPQLLVETLIKRRLLISTAESMTGGLISALITGIENSSKVLKESYILYSDDAKKKILGIKEETFDKFGVTSKEVALEMVENLSKITSSDVCVSVTGVAGPASDNRNTDIGTVFIGLKILGVTEVLSCFFTGDREKIRNQAAMTAIATIYKVLTD